MASRQFAFAWAAIQLTFWQHTATAAGVPPCDGLNSSLSKELPQSIAGLRALKAELEKRSGECSATTTASAHSTTTVDTVLKSAIAQARIKISRIEVKIADEMGAAKVEASSLAQGQNGVRGPTSRKESTPNTAKRRLTPTGASTTRVLNTALSPQIPKSKQSAEMPTNAAAQQPTAEVAANPPTPGAQQANLAIQSARATWELCRKELNAAADADQRKKWMTLYVAAAITYVEALSFMREEPTSLYGEIMSPLVSDAQARESIAIRTDGVRIRKMLQDPKTAAALRRYVETSIALGSKVDPKKTQALRKAVEQEFSEEGLDALISAWGHQQGEELARDLDALANVGDRIRNELQSNKRLLLVIEQAQPGEGQCETAFARNLEEQLRYVYGSNLHVANRQMMRTGHDLTTRLQGELAKSSTAACSGCESALGISIAQEGSSLSLTGQLAFQGSKEVVNVKQTSAVDCKKPESGLLAARGIVKELLERVAILHRSHAPFFRPIVADVRLTSANASDPVPFSCGDLRRALPVKAASMGLAFSGACNEDTSSALRDVVARTHYIPLAEQPTGHEPQVNLVQTTPRSCDATLVYEKSEYYRFSATTTPATETEDVELVKTLNAKAGDRLATCLTAYYLRTVDSAGSKGGDIAILQHENKRLRGNLAQIEDRSQLVARLLLPGVDWWHSEQASKAVAGVTWSVADIALIGGSALMLKLSIDERNSYASGSGSLDRASQMASWGFGLIGALVAERVIWGIWGPEKPAERTAK